MVRDTAQPLAIFACGWCIHSFFSSSLGEDNLMTKLYNVKRGKSYQGNITL